MADVKFEVVREALTNSGIGSTTDFTIPGFGTPKAAIFIFAESNVDATLSSNGAWGFGFTDGTRRFAASLFGNHGSSSNTKSGRRQTDAAVVTRPFINNPIIEYDFNSWITDGVRVEQSFGASSFNSLCTCILIGGSDVSDAYVGNLNLGTGGTSTVSTTSPGFEPSLLCMAGVGVGPPPVSVASANMAVGAAVNDGAETQKCFITDFFFNTVNTTAIVSNTNITGQTSNNEILWQGELTSFDANGFSIKPSAEMVGDVFGYLALRFTGNPNVALVDTSIPTSGNYAQADIGFEPNFGLLFGVDGVGSRNALSLNGGVSINASAFDGASTFSSIIYYEDNVVTANSKNATEDRLYGLDGQGNVDFVGGSAVFDADGWDFALSTNPASAILGWGLAIGGGASTTVGAPSPLQQLSNQFSTIAASRLNGVLQ